MLLLEDDGLHEGRLHLQARPRAQEHRQGQVHRQAGLPGAEIRRKHDEHAALPPRVWTPGLSETKRVRFETIETRVA